MAKVVQVHKVSEDAVGSVQLLAGKTRRGQDERILKRTVQKIVLPKESDVRFPDDKCQNKGSLS